MTTATKAINLGVGDCETAPEMWDRICSVLAEHRRLFVFADFDGTLSEIVEVPSNAVLDPETGRALRRMSARPQVSVAIISGRSVDDVAARVGLPLVYAGDHGLEIHAPDLEFIHPEADSLRKRLPELANRIRYATRHIPSVLVEVKRFSTSVHYRQAPPDSVQALRAAVMACLDDDAFEIRDGKCVLEVRPRLAWDKGEAVAWLLQQRGGRPEQAICIGDDQTDEDMFRRIPEAITIRVSADEDEATGAEFLLPIRAVGGFLHGVADIAEALGDGER